MSVWNYKKFDWLTESMEKIRSYNEYSTGQGIVEILTVESRN